MNPCQKILESWKDKPGKILEDHPANSLHLEREGFTTRDIRPRSSTRDTTRQEFKCTGSRFSALPPAWHHLLQILDFILVILLYDCWFRFNWQRVSVSEVSWLISVITYIYINRLPKTPAVISRSWHVRCDDYGVWFGFMITTDVSKCTGSVFAVVFLLLFHEGKVSFSWCVSISLLSVTKSIFYGEWKNRKNTELS